MLGFLFDPSKFEGFFFYLVNHSMIVPRALAIAIALAFTLSFCIVRFYFDC